jgi:hypothetical protein
MPRFLKARSLTETLSVNIYPGSDADARIHIQLTSLTGLILTVGPTLNFAPFTAEAVGVGVPAIVVVAAGMSRLFDFLGLQLLKLPTSF